jgi:hypothetical protein
MIMKKNAATRNGDKIRICMYVCMPYSLDFFPLPPPSRGSPRAATASDLMMLSVPKEINN